MSMMLAGAAAWRRDSGSPPPDTGFAGAVLARSPWGYWKLDDLTGSALAVDSSPNGRNGAVQGSVAFEQPGLFAGTGTAALFSAAGIDLPTTYSVPVAPNPRRASILVNFKTTSVGLRQLLSSDFDWRCWQMRLNSGRLEIITFSPTFGDTFDAGGPFNDGARHQIVVVFDDQVPVADGQLKVYADGALIFSSTRATNFAPYGAIINPALGFRGSGGWWEPYSGTMDDAALFYSALSEADVQALWNARDVL